MQKNHRFRTRRQNSGFQSPYQSLEPRQLLASVVANFSTDFPSSQSQPTAGWEFQWNAPTPGDLNSGAIDDPATVFKSLRSTNTINGWTSDGDTNFLSDPSGGFVRLSQFGGHPGVGSETPASNIDRYSIASFTVSESGHYQLTDSVISLFPKVLNGNTDGVEYRVFVNREAPVERGVVTKNSKAYFDTSLGFLKSGDTVHVAFGANGTHYHDYFETDFSLTHTPELEQTVGNFRNDFASTTSTNSQSEYGWDYLWNAPSNWTGAKNVNHRSGVIGNPDSYQQLQLAGDTWTADGDLDGLNSAPDYFLRLDETGGQPGNGFQPSFLADRFTIAAFTVEHSGIYGLADSFITVAGDSLDGMEVIVHVEDGPILLSKNVSGGANVSFDTDLGYMTKGDTVYVAFGANGGHARDKFEMDFSVKRVLPRPAPNLSLLDHDGEIVSVNDAKFGAVRDDHRDDRLAIEAALQYAKSVSASELSFNRGTYNISTDGLTEFESIFRISRTSDLVVNGNGSTLIVDSYTHPLFTSHFSSNIIFKDMTIDFARRVPASGSQVNDLYKPLTFTQGVISNLNPASNTFTLNVNTDAFVSPDETFTIDNSRGWGYAVDRYVNGRLKTGSDWHYPTRGVTPGAVDGQYTIEVSHTVGLANGDRYIMQRRHNVSMFGMYNGSEDITVMGVTAYSAPAVFVGSLYSSSINVIDSDVKIRPNDWPTDPTAQRWKSINADGVHIQSARVGAWVENSTFDGLGDDVMNFYTRPMTIHSSASPTQFTIGLVVDNDIRTTPEATLQPGDHLTFYDPVEGGIIRKVQVVTAERVFLPSPTEPGESVGMHSITIDQPVTGFILGSHHDAGGYRDDTTVFNADISESAVVQDSLFSNSRRYGNFLMASNVQLIDNVYEGLSDEAIAAHNEPGWPLGLFADDILIQGNEFSNNGFSFRYLYDDFHSGTIGFKAARFLLPTDPTNRNGELNQLVDENIPAFSDLQIRDNLFYHWRKSAISIRNADNVEIVGNTISTGLDKNLSRSTSKTPPFDIHFTQNVSIVGNSYDGGYQTVSEGNNVGLSESETRTAGQQGLSTWAKFDKGAILQDSSGNGSTVRFSSPNVSAEGKFYTSAKFTGANTVSLTQATENTTTQRTVSLWFNVDDASRDGKQVLFEEGNLSNGLNIYIDEGMLFVGGWALGRFNSFLNTSVESGKWNHVALVIDSTAGKLRGYLNGKKFQAADATEIPVHGRIANVGRVGQAGTRFANDEVFTGAGSGLVGNVDDVRIYDRAIGDREISGLAGR
ncbi:MAG: LamG domain-containing protein [Mariniblastus sp.]